MNVECTPEEARIFMGLPDVQPMQQALMQEIQDQMSSNLRLMNPETVMKSWLPTGFQNADQLQKLFWDGLRNAFANMTGTANTMLTFTDGKRGSLSKD